MNPAEPRRAAARRLVLMVACALVLAALPAEGDLVRNPDAVPTPDARAVFELIRRAFEDGDQQIMADLVHPDGLRVRRGGDDLRETTYSPSQAFYYFKNLFQAEQTVTFTFLRMEEADGGRVHAMATWVHRRSGDAADREVQLVFVLSRQGPTWRMAEITTIG